MEKSKELEERVSDLEKQNDEVSVHWYCAFVLMENLQLNRKVKILESDLEQTEDALDDKRQYELHLVCKYYLVQTILPYRKLTDLELELKDKHETLVHLERREEKV